MSPKNRKRTPPPRGSALVLTLILLAVAGIAVAAYVSSARTGMLIERARTQSLAAKNSAEEGILLAKSDLLQHGTAQDFAGVAEAAERGLIYAEGEPTKARYPQTEGCTVCRNVWYHPSERNTADSTTFPKIFTVVSEASNVATGESYSIEAMLVVRKENFAELSYAILDPTGPMKAYHGWWWPGHVMYAPFELAGRAHFGDFDLYFWRPDIPSSKFKFNAPVTFAHASGGPGTYPFVKADEADVTFKKGYKTGVNLNYDVAAVYNSAVASETSGLLDSSLLPDEDLCLKFDRNTIYRYQCNPEQVNVSPLDRYIGEKTNAPGAIVQTITLPPGGAVLYWPESIHVKGILDGRLTVVTGNNVVPDGDVQYYDQKDSSNDRFGAVAWNNLFIHHSVPNGKGHWAPYRRTWGNFDSAFWAPYENVVNFNVSNDRDPEDITGLGNAYEYLDLDGAYFAVNGTMYVDNVNDFEHSTWGMVIPGKDGNLYSLNPDDANYYYTKDGSGNINGRKADPLYCMFCCNTAVPECPPYEQGYTPETGTPGQRRVSIFGSMVMKEHPMKTVPAHHVSHMSPSDPGWEDPNYHNVTFDTWQPWGIYEMKIRAHPALATSPPPGFPTTERVVLNTAYTRTSSHRLGANP